MTIKSHLIDRLPELPVEAFEAAGTLERSDRGPFITLRPPKQPEPVRPTSTSRAPNKSSFLTRKYFAWALYPRVICYDPGDLVAGLEMNIDPPPHPGRNLPPTDLAVLARQERFYKLSSLQSRVFQHPLFCSVKYGPWTALVSETESCIDNVPNQWEFFIADIPQVGMIWFGTWEDIPSFPSLTVVMGSLAQSSQTSQCCAGFQWCPTTQSCIPLQVTCQDPVPA